MSKTRKNFADQGSMIARDLGLGLPNGSPGLAEFAAEAGFASIWDRPALTKEDRFFPVLATLAALDRQEVLSAHIKAALNIGLTPRAIQEIIIQCAL
jgi:alkylhydroperoxidase/carboxymuconolactone decarboxylase family protein YurZ